MSVRLDKIFPLALRPARSRGWLWLGVLAVVLLLLGVISTQSRAASIHGESGSLIYLDGIDGNFNSLVYRTNSGNILRVFDEGLSFNYGSLDDASSVSPDKTYSVVHFSETGLDEQHGIEKIYMCAFVRMKDGCVVNVESGEQCGGEWRGARHWSSSINRVSDYSIKEAPTVSKIYKDYESGRKDLTQLSSPRILAYFSEGTTFDNLLVCDPPNDSNKNAYTAMLALLQRDGDTKNTEKLKAALKSVGILSVGDKLVSTQTMISMAIKVVSSDKAYLYSSPSSLDITQSYLIRGDVVSVLSSPNNSFIKVSYQPKGGKPIEKWVRCEDIDFCER